MRVMLVGRRFPPDELGGVEQYTQSLAAQLAKRGDTVSIIAQRAGCTANGFNVIRERLPEGPLLYRLLAKNYDLLRFLDGQDLVERLLTLALLESRPEVVHFNHLMGFSPRAIQLAHRLGAAVVLSLHDFYLACPTAHLQKPSGEPCKGPDSGRECATVCFGNRQASDRVYWGLRALYFQRALEAADRAVAYSRYVADYFGPMRSGTAIEVIEHGILPAQTSDYAGHNSKSGLTLAYCGVVAPHKGPEVILDALRIARFESVRFSLIGQTPDKSFAAKLRKKAAEIPGMKLQMYGTYTRNELPLLLRGVDCVIVPSLVPEAAGIVPREALAAGVPVLSSNLGALPELIIEGQNGFIFDPFQPGELAAILRRLENDAELLARLRTGARGSPVVTLAAHAEKVRTVYQSAIEDFKATSAARRGTSEFDFLHDALEERDRSFVSVASTARAATVGG